MGGRGLDKNFFPSLNMYQAKSGVKNFPLYRWGGVPQQKFFFPVWTCIKPNLVSKIFPFTSWWGGDPWQKFFFPVWTCIKPNLLSKNFSFTETRYPPHPRLDWTPPHPRLDQVPPPIQGWIGTPLVQDWIGTPLSKAEGWIGTPLPCPRLKAGLGPSPPRRSVDRHTDRCQNITFPSYYVRGRW